MPNKYGNRKTEVDGFTFDSKREAQRYSELKFLEKAGVIQSLTLQPKFEISVNGQHICNYFADFEYIEDGRLIREDVKGVRTDVYKLKKKLISAIYGIEIKEVR